MNVVVMNVATHNIYRYNIVIVSTAKLQKKLCATSRSILTLFLTSSSYHLHNMGS